ncbi:DUF3298 and DUF4163 domain-containing protein [Orenia marismortui]|uniref:DUF3298 and DUF4163 domain-containing protein n=1 Tax=Orenia marismortui TaxID=46469 RepID=UPI00141705B3|nr:DUF3298 and DUF4163 domain-containing protein [Orenia marismortui]
MVDLDFIKLPVAIKTIRINRPRLKLYYPQVRGMRDLKLQREINCQIYDLVYQLIEEQGFYENPLTDITAYYEIKNNQRGILSLTLINYAYAGGAHGLTLTKSLSFDIETAKVYQLADLFKEHSNYQEVLSEIIEEQIEERDIGVIDDFPGVREDQDYYLADKCLVIYYQLYEFTPYVFGFPYFPISVYEIEDIIDLEGPLGQMLY